MSLEIFAAKMISRNLINYEISLVFTAYLMTIGSKKDRNLANIAFFRGKRKVFPEKIPKHLRSPRARASSQHEISIEAYGSQY